MAAWTRLHISQELLPIPEALRTKPPQVLLYAFWCRAQQAAGKLMKTALVDPEAGNVSLQDTQG